MGLVGRTAPAAVAAMAVVAGATAFGSAGLSPFVARSGEETGFQPHSSAQVYRTATGFLSGERGSKTYAADLRRLRHDGFAGAAREHMDPIDTSEQAGGLSYVVELHSHAAALDDARAELAGARSSQGTTAVIHRFTVSGVPGARGFTVAIPGRPGMAANAFWTEGRCVLLLGDVRGTGDVRSPVVAGVHAVYARTHGRCP